MEEYPFIVDELSLKAFVRFEITYDEMTEGHKNVVFDDHKMELEDLTCAMENLKAVSLSRKDFCEEWYEHVSYSSRTSSALASGIW